MSHEIDFEQSPGAAHEIRHVFRLARGDHPIRYIQHLYEDGGWRFGATIYGEWVANPLLFGDLSDSAWAYVISFTDDTSGTCRVRHINAALAALGARVA